MQVPHEVRESPGRGRGIFATQDIKRGELVWKWSEGESVKLWRTEDEVRAHFASLARDKIQFWLSHVWAWDGQLVQDQDDSHYLNHSKVSNNIGYHPDEVDIRNPHHDPRHSWARRDIAAGEELLEDYGEYHKVQWFEDLAKEYDVMSCVECAEKY